MEQQPEPTDTPEAKQEARRFENFPEALGFVETEELARIRGQWVEAIIANSAVAELATHYQALGQEVVSQYQGEDSVKAEIGLNIQMALIRRAGGRLDHYAEDLEIALTYAWQAGFDDIAAIIQEALDEIDAES